MIGKTKQFWNYAPPILQVTVLPNEHFQNKMALEILIVIEILASEIDDFVEDSSIL